MTRNNTTRKLDARRVQIRNAIILLDPEDIENFALSFNWTQRKDGYVVRGKRVNGKYNLFYLHREVFRRSGVGNDIPHGCFIDHVNRDKLDNRRSNLRLVTPQQSAYNRKGQKDYKGVSLTEDGWIAHITVEGRQIYLGTFPSERIAAGIYNKAARDFHGEHAALNDLLPEEDNG